MKSDNQVNINYAIGVLEFFYKQTDNSAAKQAIEKLEIVLATEPNEY